MGTAGVASNPQKRSASNLNASGTTRVHFERIGRSRWAHLPARRSSRTGAGPKEAYETGIQAKIRSQLKEFLSVFLFLALFFSAFATYRMLLLDEFGLGYFNYGSTMVSALVLSKIILLGEYAHLGRRHEGTALIVSTLYKSLVFGLLAAAFHILEEGTKEFLFRTASFHLADSRKINESLARTLVMFCAFIPFFAFRETARVLGEGKLYELFFHGRSVTESGVSNKPAAETGS
jgi:hypothetical protein